MSLSIPDKVCRACGVEVQKEIVRCEKCNLPYHPGCHKKKKCCSSRPPSPTCTAAITKDDLSLMLSDQLKKISLQINPIQTTVTDISQRVNSIENTISSAMVRVDVLENDFQGMKSEITSLNNKLLTLSDHILSDCVQEIDERNRRKSNLIIYNLSESGNESPAGGLSNTDSGIVNNIINFLLPNENIPIHSMSRLGNYQQMSPRPRPLRVFLTDEISVKKVTVAFKTAKASRTQLPVFIHRDMTMSWDKSPLQTRLFKEAQASMNERLSKGETDLRIVYRRGVPIIIPVKTRVTRTPPTP